MPRPPNKADWGTGAGSVFGKPTVGAARRDEAHRETTLDGDSEEGETRRRGEAGNWVEENDSWI